MARTEIFQVRHYKRVDEQIGIFFKRPQDVGTTVRFLVRIEFDKFNLKKFQILLDPMSLKISEYKFTLYAMIF